MHKSITQRSALLSLILRKDDPDKACLSEQIRGGPYWRAVIELLVGLMGLPALICLCDQVSSNGLFVIYAGCGLFLGKQILLHILKSHETAFSQYTSFDEIIARHQGRLAQGIASSLSLGALGAILSLHLETIASVLHSVHGHGWAKGFAYVLALTVLLSPRIWILLRMSLVAFICSLSGLLWVLYGQISQERLTLSLFPHEFWDILNADKITEGIGFMTPYLLWALGPLSWQVLVRRGKQAGDALQASTCLDIPILLALGILSAFAWIYAPMGSSEGSLRLLIESIGDSRWQSLIALSMLSLLLCAARCVLDACTRIIGEFFLEKRVSLAGGQEAESAAHSEGMRALIRVALLAMLILLPSLEDPLAFVTKSNCLWVSVVLLPSILCLKGMPTNATVYLLNVCAQATLWGMLWNRLGDFVLCLLSLSLTLSLFHLSPRIMPKLRRLHSIRRLEQARHSERLRALRQPLSAWHPLYFWIERCVTHPVKELLHFLDKRMHDSQGSSDLLGSYGLMNSIVSYFFIPNSLNGVNQDLHIYIRGLTGVCSILIMLKDFWMPLLRRYYSLAFYLVTCINIPFTAFFMILDSRMHPGWMLSAFIASAVMALLVDGLMLISLWTLGYYLAWIFFTTYSMSWKPVFTTQIHLILLINLAAALIMRGLYTLWNQYREPFRLVKFQDKLSILGWLIHELDLNRRGPQKLSPHLSGAPSVPIPQQQRAPFKEKSHPNFVEKKPPFVSIAHLSPLQQTKIQASRARLLPHLRRRLTQRTMTSIWMGVFMNQLLQRHAPRTFLSERLEWENWYDFKFEAEPLRLRYVIVTLIKNALASLKWIRGVRRPLIRIWTDASLDNYTYIGKLHIWDNGIGIPKRAMAHLFEDDFVIRSPRYAPQAAHQPELHACKQLLERFGAKLTCQSHEGQFTHITLHFLPARDVDWAKIRR